MDARVFATNVIAPSEIAADRRRTLTAGQPSMKVDDTAIARKQPVRFGVRRATCPQRRESCHDPVQDPRSLEVTGRGPAGHRLGRTPRFCARLSPHRAMLRIVVMAIFAFVLSAVTARPALPVAEAQARRGGGFDCVRLQHVRPPPVPLSSPKEEIIYVPCRESYDPTWPEA
jgi:hypothetical protein